jgi:carboxyl-terminal processing protease
VKRTSAVPSGVSAALVGAGGFVRDDESQLSSQLLPGGVGYISWREWVDSGTYKQHLEVQKAMDRLLGQGAKAWLFDVTNNGGGIQNQTMMSWFNNGEPVVKIRLKNGYAGSIEAKKELRLPDRYQLPVAVVVNGRSASMSELFALAFKETKRGTIFGTKTIGCLGSTNILNLIDGSIFQYTLAEFVGGVTNTTYNNVGITPDQTIPDAQAVEAAASFLREQIAKGAKP